MISIGLKWMRALFFESLAIGTVIAIYFGSVGNAEDPSKTQNLISSAQQRISQSAVWFKESLDYSEPNDRAHFAEKQLDQASDQFIALLYRQADLAVQATFPNASNQLVVNGQRFRE